MKYFDLNDIDSSVKWIWKNEKNIFEKEFARYIGTKYAIGTSYGRTALYLGLKAIDVQDREVLIPAFTCTVVRHAVVMAGAVPQFVDIDFNNFNLSLDDLRRKISPKTRAIILIHYFGRVARNIEKVIQFARENNLILIEDCAHSLGAEYNGKKIGTFGDFSIFSLTKNMINFGGGVLVTNNDNIYQKARDILENERKSIKTRIIDFPLVLAYGIEQAIDKLIFDRVGNKKWWLINLSYLPVKFRQYLLSAMRLPLTIVKVKKKNKNHRTVNSEQKKTLNYEQNIDIEPIICSLGRSQLKKIDSLIDKRKKVHDKLLKCINLHLNDKEDINTKDVYTYIVLRFRNKNIFEIIENCKNIGLLLRATWPTHQSLWKNQDTENVSRIKKEVLTWNVNPNLTKQEIEKFIQIVSNINDTAQFLEETLSQQQCKTTFNEFSGT